MKKFLAAIMALVMLFTLAALPVAAAAEKEETTASEEITLEGAFESIESMVYLIQEAIVKVHGVVGSILGMLGKECPMCGEVHEKVEADEETDEEVAPPVDDEETLPEEDEDVTTEDKKESTLEDAFESIETTVYLIEDTLVKVHYIVGTILGMLDKECPLCGEVHEITVEDEKVEAEEENTIPDDVVALLAA